MKIYFHCIIIIRQILGLKKVQGGQVYETKLAYAIQILREVKVTIKKVIASLNICSKHAFSSLSFLREV